MAPCHSIVAELRGHRCYGLESVSLAFREILSGEAEGSRRSRRLGRSNGNPPCAVHLTISTPYHKQYIGDRLSTRLRAGARGQNFSTGWKLDGELEEVICVDASVDQPVGRLFAVGRMSAFVPL